MVTVSGWDDETCADRLRSVGLRVTPGRVAALAHLATHPHLSAAELRDAITAAGIELTAQSMHNIVRDLTEKGLLHRIDPPGSAAVRYEVHTHDHHHLVCIECGRVLDVDRSVAAAPELDDTLAQGMRILETSVTYLGICADCQSRNPHSPTNSVTTKEKER